MGGLTTVDSRSNERINGNRPEGATFAQGNPTSQPNAPLNTSVVSAPKIGLSAPVSALGNGERMEGASSSGGNAVWDFVRSMFLDDFVKAGKALLQSGLYQFQCFGHALLAGGKFLIGDYKGAQDEAKKSLEAMKLSGQVLAQNALEIVFAVATVVSIVGSAGAATAGVIALRQLLKEGVKHALKEIGKLAVERVTTWGVSQVAKLSSVKAALPLTKEAAEITTKLSGKVSKVFGKELLDVAKVTERESQMLDSSREVLKTSIEASRKAGKPLDVAGIEKSLTEANKSVLVDGQYEKFMEDKLHDLLKLAEIQPMTKAEVTAMKGEIRSLGFADEEVEEVYSLLTNRNFRIALNSGQYDAEIAGELINVLKRDLRKVVNDGLKSGNLGREYLAGWEKHLDELYKSGEITAEERDALKAAGKNAIEKGYREGVDEAVEKAVNNAMKRLRAKDSDDGSISLDDDKKKKKKTPSLFGYFKKLIEEQGMGLAEDANNRPKLIVADGASGNSKSPIHWLRQYFLDREKREEMNALPKGAKISGGVADTRANKELVTNVPPPRVTGAGSGGESRAA